MLNFLSKFSIMNEVCIEYQYVNNNFGERCFVK